MQRPPGWEHWRFIELGAHEPMARARWLRWSLLLLLLLLVLLVLLLLLLLLLLLQLGRILNPES